MAPYSAGYIFVHFFSNPFKQYQCVRLLTGSKFCFWPPGHTTNKWDLPVMQTPAALQCGDHIWRIRFTSVLGGPLINKRTECWHGDEDRKGLVPTSHEAWLRHMDMRGVFYDFRFYTTRKWWFDLTQVIPMGELDQWEGKRIFGSL